MRLSHTVTRKMAEPDAQKVEAILQDYAETLEILTINSKPLINDLTMAADRYKQLAPQIVGKIESRLFEVATAAFNFLSSVLCIFSVYSFSICLLYSLFSWFVENGYERRHDIITRVSSSKQQFLTI